MVSWAITTKQKTEEKAVIRKAFFYENLCTSLLKTFFENYNKVFYFPTASASGVEFKDNKIITKILNQTLIQYNVRIEYSSDARNIKISNTSLNNRYCLNFNNTTCININASIENLFINIFIVYKINTPTQALFSMVNKTVPPSETAHLIMFNNGSLIIGATMEDFIVIGTNSFKGREPIANYQNKANAGEINKWHCLSVHWKPKSSVWCNGQKLTNFTSRTIAASSFFTHPFYIGCFFKSTGVGPGTILVERLNGSIALFSYNSKAMADDEIKLHHHVFIFD